MYAKEVTEASESALLELGLALKRYREDMVLAGGWAPYFIVGGYFPHCGSIDIDLVLKTEIMRKYDTIRKSVIELGYVEENLFRFSRIVQSPVDKLDYEIHLDFLCDSEGAKYVDVRRVQEDLHAFMFRGLNLAFDFNFEQEIKTVLPANGQARTNIKVVDIVGSFALKGEALDGRAKPKDSYDVFALVHCEGGPAKAAAYFNDRISGKKLAPENVALLKRSLSVVREKFADADPDGAFPG